MSSFIIELGNESGEGKYRQWDSQGFYAGYTDKGPIIVSTRAAAWRFPSLERAARIPSGDDRLRNSRILTEEAEPNV